MKNKAHSATIRRLAERFAATPGRQAGFDLVGPGVVIEVETSATLPAGVKRLQQAGGRRYVAVTNNESLEDALRLTHETGIGVLSPRGEIVRDAVSS